MRTAIKKFNTILLGFGRRGDYLSLFLGVVNLGVMFRYREKGARIRPTYSRICLFVQLALIRKGAELV
jgi:hypothetical protein